MRADDPERKSAREQFLGAVRSVYGLELGGRHAVPYADGRLKGFLSAYRFKPARAKCTIVLFGGLRQLWTATRGRLASWAYTLNVASLPQRLTSLAIVTALSGSPAALSACMALCLQGVATATSHTDSKSAGHGAHVAAVAQAGVSAHAHHGSPVSNESATGTAAASSHSWSEARVSASCTNCCPEGQAMMVAGPGVERIDVKSFSATPIASRMTSFLVTLPGLGASPPGPPGPPPPNRAPLALRI